MKSARTKKIIKVTVSVICAIALLVIAFFAGFWTKGLIGNSSIDWVLSVINEYYYKEIDMEEAENYAIDELISRYLDIYSEYYTAEEYAALVSSNQGYKSGIGISVIYLEGVGISVYSCVGNSPAFNAGIRSGDVLLSAELDGETTEFSSLSDFSSFVNKVGDDDVITFNTDNGSVSVQKAAYSASYVLFATNETAWTFTGSNALDITESKQDAIEYLDDDTAYISLSQFYGNAVTQFGEAVEKFNETGCTKLILDLRNDGGGYVSVMQNIASFFQNCEVGSVAMEARYRDGSSSYYEIEGSSSGQKISSDTEVYVMANGNTASASEALIGCLISYGVTDYDNIYISEYTESYITATGSTAEDLRSGYTYGKGIMQSTIVNPATGEALKLTTAQIYWPNGVTIHGVGLSSKADAENRCNSVEAPLAISGKGAELEAVVRAISGST